MTGISARDPNDRLSCDIEVRPPTRMAALLPVVEDEIARLGYRMIEVPGRGGRTFTRFVGEGRRFGIPDSTSTGPGLPAAPIRASARSARRS